jgi:hypothetical protein
VHVHMVLTRLACLLSLQAEEQRASLKAVLEGARAEVNTLRDKLRAAEEVGAARACCEQPPTSSWLLSNPACFSYILPDVVMLLAVAASMS